MIRRTVDFPGFLHAVRLERDVVPDFADYPFSIPAVRGLETLSSSTPRSRS
jgi:predicted ATPase